MNLFKRLVKILASPLLAIVLLVIMFMASVFGALLYTDLLQDTINKDANEIVFYSNWFLVLNFLLLINVTFCSIRQINRAMRRYKKSKATPAQARRLFLLPLFHLGLTLIIMGAFIDYSTGFEGTLPVSPNVVVEDRRENYVDIDERPLSPKKYGRFNLLLREINFDYSSKGAISSGLVTVYQEDKAVLNQVLDSNNPIWLQKVSISKDSFHYYIDYVVRNKNGRVIDDRSLGLDTTFPPDATKYSRENFRLENSPYRFTIEFFPDVNQVKGQYVSASYKLVNPAILMTVHSGDKTVFSGLIKKGETVQFSDDSRFTFNSVTPYLYLRVQSVLGTYILAFGFLVFTTGLLLYYICYPPKGEL